MINKNSKIFLTGHCGMVGSSCLNQLKKNGYNNVITQSSKDLDLRNQKDVLNFFKVEKPDVVINAAARVGGILANDQYPYQFPLDNMQMQNNLISSSHNFNVEKFIFLGSSCIYPKFSNQPILEEYLLTGELEPTNQWYAIAKISGLKLIESLKKQYNRNYVALMPTNLFGPNDNFDLETSHVIPAMIRKFHEAMKDGHKTVNLWGTGSPRREFLHVDDLAKSVIFALENNLPGFIYNVGTGEDMTIKNVADIIQTKVGHKGKIAWDSNKPDGTPKKLLDISKLSQMGWSYKIEFKDGIEKTYKWYLSNIYNYRKTKII